MTRLPLEGIRILETADVWAGPYTCSLLGDMGAEVIKVESIQRMSTRGQTLRPPKDAPGYVDKNPGERPWERASVFNGINRNKLGITLNLKDPDGVKLYKSLVKVSDILVENYATGVLDNLGVGYEVLRQINPGLIMISMPLFGSTGPYKNYRGNGGTCDPVTGHTLLRCYEDNDPYYIGQTVHTDAVSSTTAVFAVLTALFYRRRTGVGQYLDLAHSEGIMPHLGEAIMDYTMNGRVAQSTGNRGVTNAPQGCYRCKGDDRWVTIAVTNDKEWTLLQEAMGNPAWAKADKFQDALSRLENQDELDKHIEEWAIEKDHYEAMHLLQELGVPSGTVIDHAEAYADPHIRARGFFEKVTHREAGTHEYAGNPWKLTKTPASIRIPATCLGEYNKEVLCGLLGLSADELQSLEDKQVIGDAYLEGADIA